MEAACSNFGGTYCPHNATKNGSSMFIRNADKFLSDYTLTAIFTTLDHRSSII